MALKLKNYNPLLVCGLIGPVFFIVSFAVQGIFKAGYSALRHPISSLAIGHNGWVQVITFLITGLLLFLFAVGVYQKLNNTKLNFILGPVRPSHPGGQCSQAEIQARFMCGWLLVNTDRTDYKVTSV